MAQNVAAIMERGDRLDNIEGRTRDLHESVSLFNSIITNSFFTNNFF